MLPTKRVIIAILAIIRLFLLGGRGVLWFPSSCIRPRMLISGLVLPMVCGGREGGGCTSNSIYFCGIPDLPPVWRLQSPPAENSSKLFAHAIFGPVCLNVLSNAFRECGWLVVRRCCERNSRPITTEIGARWGNIRLSGRPRGRRYGVLAYFPGFACARKKKLDFPSRHEAK